VTHLVTPYFFQTTFVPHGLTDFLHHAPAGTSGGREAEDTAARRLWARRLEIETDRGAV